MSQSGPQGPQFHSKNVTGERTPLRSFSEIGKKKGALKDRDVQDANVRVKALLAGIPGAIMGAALGYFTVAQYGMGVWMIPVCMLLMAAFVSTLTLMVVSGGAAMGRGIYAPTGGTVPKLKEYSYPESLVARGMYVDAVSAFELVIVEEGETDPTPYIRIARVYRDHLERFEDSARWFNRALNESDIHRGLATLIRKELVELYRVKLMMPQKAAPMLARIADEMAGTPDGEWAAEELAFVKEQMRQERDR